MPHFGHVVKQEKEGCTPATESDPGMTTILEVTGTTLNHKEKRMTKTQVATGWPGAADNAFAGLSWHLILIVFLLICLIAS